LLQEVKSCIQRKDETLRLYIQRWSIIKNSAEDVSDERVVDAFLAGLCRSNLVEELGRTRPRTVSELIEIANKFANGEDAYNNKRDQKSTEQAGKGAGLTMKIAAQDKIR
jgi:hypothetical protein